MKKIMSLKKRYKWLDSSIFYMVLGIVLAFGINWGLAFALNTDMPVVAVESNSMVPAFYKGDNNNGQLPFEKRIEASQVHGKTIAIIPYLGWLKIGLMEYALPNLIWLLLAGGAIAFICLGIKSYRGHFWKFGG